MDIRKEKMELIKLLMHTQDKETLDDIRGILKRKKIAAKTYPDELIASIEKGLKQIKDGQTVSDREVQKLYAKWL